MKPLLSYYGGKQRLAPTIISLMPHFKSYIEPFCGGAAVFFALPEDKKRVEVLNDKDERIVTLYRVAKTKTDALIEMIDGTPYSRSCHKRASNIWDGKQEATDLEVAWAVYVTIMQGFGNKAAHGWGYSKEKKLAQFYTMMKSRLKEQINRLDNAYIECDDALRVIARWDSEDAFFYLDPPYPETDCGHYEGYSLNDYKTLIDLLATIKGKFLLSNYHQAVTIPEKWIQIEKSLLCSVTNTVEKRGKRTEVIIGNCTPRQTSFFDADWDG